MGENMAEVPTFIGEWSKTQLKHWIVDQLKLDQKYADILYSEDVSGSELLCFVKKDLLDIGVKTGPAVTILCKRDENVKFANLNKIMPKDLTTSLNLPNNLDCWSKEQVMQWVVAELNIDKKYAEILHNEDVSGTALQYLKKEDFQDMGIKAGPAVKILYKIDEFKCIHKDNKTEIHTENSKANAPKCSETMHELDSSDKVTAYSCIPEKHNEDDAVIKYIKQANCIAPEEKVSTLYETRLSRTETLALTHHRAVTDKRKIIDKTEHNAAEITEKSKELQPDSKAVVTATDERMCQKSKDMVQTISDVCLDATEVRKINFEAVSEVTSKTEEHSIGESKSRQTTALGPLTKIEQPAGKTKRVRNLKSQKNKNIKSATANSAENNKMSSKKDDQAGEMNNGVDISKKDIKKKYTEKTTEKTKNCSYITLVVKDETTNEEAFVSLDKHKDVGTLSTSSGTGNDKASNISEKNPEGGSKVCLERDEKEQYITCTIRNEYDTLVSAACNHSDNIDDDAHDTVTVKTKDQTSTTERQKVKEKMCSKTDQKMSKKDTSDMSKVLKDSEITNNNTDSAFSSLVTENNTSLMSCVLAENKNMMDANHVKDQRHIKCTQTRYADLSLHTEEGRKESNFVLQPEQENLQTIRHFCQSHPFNCTQACKRYIVNECLCPETGPSNLIEPIHEFKLFKNTENAKQEDILKKFSNESFRFAAACINSRTNGTIHFGVGDVKSGYCHGTILGLEVDDPSKYIDALDKSFVQYFEPNDIEDAKMCIKPPRFVEVISSNQVLSQKFVIEVDVEPVYCVCLEKMYYICMMNQNDKQEWRKSKEKYLFIRDGASSRNILANRNEADRGIALLSFQKQIKTLAERRKAAEEKISTRKATSEGSNLIRMLTGGRDSLDNSYYEWYVMVVNKCHPNQKDDLTFLKEIKWFAVLDFDPESVTSGVCELYRQDRAANLHLPRLYQDLETVNREKFQEMNLYKQPSWIFCNGRSDLAGKEYKPLESKLWLRERAAVVRKLVTFLCQPDVLQNGKFLVVFLLLSTVNDPKDPILETMSFFYQELKGEHDILCICTQDKHFLPLVKDRFDKEFESRCISQLNLSDINTTVLKLKSVTQSSKKFLPAGNSTSTILEKKDEEMMTELEILCENQCEGTDIEKDVSRFTEFKISQEEHFYRGGKASWWNFFFSSKGYSESFVKRDAYVKLEKMINLGLDSPLCVKIINLFHHPGCGGTSLAMHVLWENRKKFRCAVLKSNAVDPAEVGRQVIDLLTYPKTHSCTYVPVLLLVDDFEEIENVKLLQNCIQLATAERNLRFQSALVIILNCIRSQDPDKSLKASILDSISLKHELSDVEQRLFKEKCKEIKDQHKKFEDFYSFMIMKNNFDKKYIENVVRNTLKGLCISTRQAWLISVLALLNSYVKGSSLSRSKCEEFLGISDTRTYWIKQKFEDVVGTYSTLFIQTEVEEYGRYKAMCISHPLIAIQILEELKSQYKLQKSTITVQLLTENIFYERNNGKEKHLQDVWSMLITRHRKEHGDEMDTLFSPLIEAIQKDEGNAEVRNVLHEAAGRYDDSPFICQALARYFYLKDKDFVSALKWAKKAKEQAKSNSYIADTLGQVFKSELKYKLETITTDKTIITPDQLRNYLYLAQSAAEAFRESQELAERKGNEAVEWQDQKVRRKYETYNTLGYLGEIEVAGYIVEILGTVSLFNKQKEMAHTHLVQYLSGSMQLRHEEFTSEGDLKYLSVLEDYDGYLSRLRSDVKRAYEFFLNYFVHLKPRVTERETAEFKIRCRVSEHFAKYKDFFCQFDKKFLDECMKSSKLSFQLQIQEARNFLEAHKADCFSGLIEYLSHSGLNEYLSHEDKCVIVEKILKSYWFILDASTKKIYPKDKVNFILANVVLHCIKPKSKHILPYENLKSILKEVLHEVGTDYRYAEPYFLAVLFFWPSPQKKEDKESKNVTQYVEAMRKGFRSQYRRMCFSKQPIAHFYLGKKSELRKFLSKAEIDGCFKDVPDLDYLWQTGEIWKDEKIKNLLCRVEGRTDIDDKVYVVNGFEDKFRIPVRPVYLGKLRSGRSIEKLSFYLGFSIDGPVAYDIV
ncbi:sterile alpha motif domain-containing protein 9-like [Protopterus annectens]|uniref:sterile alpha motif domain-containing protein 9-like n=1 Tax=Protopterus annectens TaxID=7888 RepID=UPI001CFBE172|nr:sterile alpha motif domain-containing protein 9-like [Protopterus annectens]